MNPLWNSADALEVLVQCSLPAAVSRKYNSINFYEHFRTRLRILSAKKTGSFSQNRLAFLCLLEPALNGLFSSYVKKPHLHHEELSHEA